ncbi:MAG TPA: TIGR03620 family F420-dependent LLM class oxidoreductase, partial [Actinomycetota bacterium]|nr:TIGR03620 family F420-dependent LLM class oxidoreductase [Actinomycetota bacterium]
MVEEPLGLGMREEREALRSALGRVGVWSFALETQTAAEEREAAAQIESLGYPAIWIPESVTSREAFSHASWLLGSTERAVVATGIANVWARDPVAMANGWRMLTDAYPNRFLLGLGVSHSPSVSRRGGHYERPWGKMREYLDAMDRAASSALEPEAEPRRVLAALGPRMLELAAERALGAHPYFVPVEHTPGARSALGPEPCLAVEQTAVLSTDAEAARRIGRAFARHYLALPNYA